MSSPEKMPQMPAESNENNFGPLEAFEQKVKDSADLLEGEPERIIDLLEELEGDYEEAGLDEEKSAIRELRTRGFELTGGTSDMEQVLEDALEEVSFSGELREKVKDLLVAAAERTNNTAQEQIEENF